MTTLADRIEEYGITADVFTDYSPDSEIASQFGSGSHHYQVEMTRTDQGGRSRIFRTEFHTGSSCGFPTAYDVLRCLLADAASLEYANGDSYESWAEDLGFDPDSRKGEATFRAAMEQSDGLMAFLDDHDDIGTIELWLHETERD